MLHEMNFLLYEFMYCKIFFSTFKDIPLKDEKDPSVREIRSRKVLSFSEHAKNCFIIIHRKKKFT